MIGLESAIQSILSAVPRLDSERIPSSAASGRFLAEEARAVVDLPVADNSAMDGYAVRVLDLSKASETSPIQLHLSGTATAGKPSAVGIAPGTCVRVFTGSVLPIGADAVVMQEDVHRRDQEVIFREAVQPWENVRLRGEDVKAGESLLKAGDRVTATGAALLCAAGLGEVRVGRRPVLGVVATGNELVESGQPLAPGMIYESNRILIAGMAAQAGAMTKVYPIVPDTIEATAAVLRQAFSECDFVVSSGGVSVGDLDYIKPALAEIGGELQFWSVAMRPGKPFAFGRWREKLLFGLPGNPVSAAITFFLLTRPALMKAQGASDVAPRKMRAPLGQAISNPGERRHFARVMTGADGRVYASGPQASHRLRSLAESCGLLDVPPGTTIPAGQLVSVILFDHV